VLGGGGQQSPAPSADLGGGEQSPGAGPLLLLLLVLVLVLVLVPGPQAGRLHREDLEPVGVQVPELCRPTEEHTLVKYTHESMY